MRHRDPDPAWVTPAIKAMRLKLDRRARRIEATLHPCRLCGCFPVVSFGLVDAPFDPGFEAIQCPRVLDVPGVLMQSCPNGAQGAAAWNWLNDPDRDRGLSDAA